jgi:hypothetical protein
MAAMCRNAFETRQRAENVTSRRHTGHDLQGTIEHFFEELHTGSTIRDVAGARRIIPLLSRTDKVSPVATEAMRLTEHFIIDYNYLRRGLHDVDVRMGKTYQTDQIFFDTLREIVRDLHNAFSKASMWYDILPYTALSLRGLRDLRSRIQHLRTYRPLTELSSSINEIEQWLSIPRPQLDFSSDDKLVARAVMQSASNEKEESFKERLRAERSEGERRHLEQIKKDFETRTKEEQKSEQQKSEQQKNEQEKIERQRIEREFAENKLRQHKQRIEEQQRAEIKRQQEQAAEEQRRLEMEAKIAEQQRQAEKKKQEEEEERNRKGSAEEARARIQKRIAELEKEKQEREAQEQEHPQEEARSTQARVLAELRTENEKIRDYLQCLIERVQGINRHKHWTLRPIEADVCYTTLNVLRSRRNIFGEDVRPQKIMEDEELLLKFERDMLNALTAIVRLRELKCAPKDIAAHTWSLSDMQQFSDTLRPFADKAPLTNTDLMLAVEYICSALEQMQREIEAEQSASFGSSTSTQATLNSFMGSSTKSNNSNTTDSTEQNDLGQRKAPVQASAQHKLNPFFDPKRVQFSQNTLSKPLPKTQDKHQLVSEQRQQPARGERQWTPTAKPPRERISFKNTNRHDPYLNPIPRIPSISARTFEKRSGIPCKPELCIGARCGFNHNQVYTFDDAAPSPSRGRSHQTPPPPPPAPSKPLPPWRPLSPASKDKAWFSDPLIVTTADEEKAAKDKAWFDDDLMAEIQAWQEEMFDENDDAWWARPRRVAKLKLKRPDQERYTPPQGGRGARRGAA